MRFRRGFLIRTINLFSVFFFYSTTYSNSLEEFPAKQAEFNFGRRLLLTSEKVQSDDDSLQEKSVISYRRLHW